MKLLLNFHFLLSLTGLCASQRAVSKPLKCERITIPLCQKIEYNLTYVPNMFQHPTQTDAALRAHQFWPLVKINCAPDLKLFICATHAPVCEESYGKPLLPCRSFCERVSNACSGVLKSHDISWPDYLNCKKFPENTGTTVCMEKDSYSKGKKKQAKSKPKTKLPLRRKQEPEDEDKRLMKNTQYRRKYPPEMKKNEKASTAKPIRLPIHLIVHKAKGETCGCMCQKPFVYVNRSIDDGPTDVPSCALQCKEYFFSRSQQNLTTFWITLWSFLCVISTFVACLTAMIDSTRFKYPERPVIFIAFCYFMVAMGYIIRLARGFENIACNSRTNLLRYTATGPADCTAVFLLVYFFGMASCIWWVILALNWFLAAGMKWTKESIASYSQYFHFIAWFVPTVQSMAVLAMAGIDSDPVSGLCYVGNHDNNMLTIFVIAPLLIFLTLGCSFIMACLLALFVSYKSSRSNGTRSQKIDRLLIKVGLYSMIYVVPITVTVLCHFYEHNNRESWEKSRNCPCVRVKDVPQHYIFLVKYLMTLLTGLATGFWVWGTTTIDSWRRCINIFCRRKHERRPKAVVL